MSATETTVLNWSRGMATAGLAASAAVLALHSSAGAIAGAAPSATDLASLLVAFGTAAAALSLLLFHSGERAPWPQAGTALSWLVLSLGAAALAAHVVPGPALAPPLWASAAILEAVSIDAAMSLILLGIALVAMRTHRLPDSWLPQLAAVVVVLVSLMVFLQRFYQVPEARIMLGMDSLTPVAAIAFIFVGIGVLLARPDRGDVAVVLSPDAGGAMARYLLPAAVIIPVLLGQLSIVGYHLGRFEMHFGTTLLVMCLIVALGYAVLLTARWLNRLDSEKKQATEELKSLTEKLKEARDRALEVSRFKSEFLANMSHEIRTPMNAVIGISNILERTPLNQHQKEHVGLLKESCKSLLTVINDVLDLSKIEAGKLVLETVEFDPVPVAEGSAAVLQAQAQAKHLALTTFVDPAIARCLYGDPYRLRQVLINLLSNAVKFTDKGSITLWVSPEAEDNGTTTVRFEVRDTGIGIPPDQVSKLFEDFVQLDGSTSRKYGGTGLGLSICRHLVHLMGGQIGAESSPGEGSTFWLSVPFERSERAARFAGDWSTLRGLKVLAVDDDPITRECLKLYLSSWSMECDLAASGEEALDKLRAAEAQGSPFQLAVIDLMMPGMTGTELAERIKEEESLSAVKLILLTAYDRTGLGEEVVESGFKGYLTKPCNQSKLFDCISNVMGDKLAVDAAKARAQTQALSGSAMAPATTAPILIVEDNEINQMVASSELQALGYRVEVVGNGRQAVEAAGAADYGLILMDCQMPEMDGYEATRAIRKQEALTGKHTPIVAMTAHALGRDREECLAAGMDDYLSKPFEAAHLKSIVEHWMAVRSGAGAPGKGADREGGSASSSGESAPHSEAEAVGAAIDLDKLKERFDSNTLSKLLPRFVSDTSSRLEELEILIGAADAKKVLSSAHYLKTSFGTVHSDDMRRLASQIEEAARGEDWTAVAEKYRQLAERFACCQEQLERERIMGT